MQQHNFYINSKGIKYFIPFLFLVFSSCELFINYFILENNNSVYRAQWNKMKSINYIIMQRFPNEHPNGNINYALRINDEVIISAESMYDGSIITGERLAIFSTINNQFDFINYAIENNFKTIDINYNSYHGYPNKICIAKDWVPFHKRQYILYHEYYELY